MPKRKPTSEQLRAIPEAVRDVMMSKAREMERQFPTNNKRTEDYYFDLVLNFHESYTPNNDLETRVPPPPAGNTTINHHIGTLSNSGNFAYGSDASMTVNQHASTTDAAEDTKPPADPNLATIAEALPLENPEIEFETLTKDSTGLGDDYSAFSFSPRSISNNSARTPRSAPPSPPSPPENSLARLQMIEDESSLTNGVYQNLEKRFGA